MWNDIFKFIVVLLFYLFLFYVYRKIKLSNNEHAKYIDLEEYSKFEERSNKIKEVCRYSMKKVLTKEELRFTLEFREYLKEKENVILLTKVRLADFLKHNQFKDFSRVSQKHIYFLISDNQGNIKLLIELDGYSHNNYKTKKNDKFKNELFKKLNIPLIRFKNYSKFDFNKLDYYIS